MVKNLYLHLFYFFCGIADWLCFFAALGRLFAKPAAMPSYYSFKEELKGETQAEVAAPAAGRVDEPGRDTAVPRVEAPAATTEHAARATAWTSRIRLTVTAIAAIPVLTPLPYVAAHVIQP